MSKYSLLVCFFFFVHANNYVAFGQDFSQIRSQINDVLEKHKVPGASVAIVMRGRVVWADGIGTCDAESKQPVTATTVFQAASISKPVAALGALRLVDEKKLKLNAPIASALKGATVTGSDVITLRQLLSHSSGLSVHGFGGYTRNSQLPTLQQILSGESPANSSAIQPESPSGKYKYSGGGYCVVQQIIMDATELPFPRAMEKLVFRPLKMEDSTYQQPLPNKLAETAASGHDEKVKVIEGKHNVYPEMAAAGLWTTANDLAKFIVAIQSSYAGGENAPLSKELANQMLTTQVEGGAGLGLFVTGSGRSGSFNHGGVNYGFRAHLVGTNNPGSGLVILTNSEHGDEVFEPIQKIIRDMAPRNRKKKR